MSPNRIIVARFSPTGRTRRLMSMIAQGLAGTALPVEELDLTDRWEREEARTFGKGDLVFLGVPVYFGRVPLPMQSLAKWTGNGAAAVPVAAYGCRAHEDTLRELAAVLRAAGFVVPAIATGVDLVVHCRRDADGHRYVEEIVETTGRTDDQVVETRPVYRAGLRAGRERVAS